MDKIIGIVLTFALITSSFGFITKNHVAYGAESQSNEMEKVLMEVKKTITVPSNLTEFDYNFQKNDKLQESEDLWIFRWSDENGDKRINATANSVGKLLSFSEYERNDDSKISKLTYEEGKQTALNFIKKAYPEFALNMKLSKNYGNDTETFVYNFILYKDNVPVDFVKINMSVNKIKNKVVNFNFVGDTVVAETFPSKSNVLPIGQAKKTYIDKNGVAFNYYSNINYKTNEIKMFPAYSLENFEKAIDGITGEEVELKHSESAVYATGARAGNKESADNSGLTAGEIAEIDKVSGLLSKDAAEKIAKSYIVHLNSNVTFENSKLYKYYTDKDKFYWNFYFENGSVTIDGKTGELISFYFYSNDSNKGSNIEKNKVKQLGEDYIKNVAKNKNFGQMKEVTTIMPNEISYVRQENDISVEPNKLTVSIDKNTGKVNGYNYTWYDKVSFPTIENVIGTEKAFDLLSETGKFQLTYVKDVKGEIRLVYKMVEPVPFYVEPLKGEKIDYSGSTYIDSVIPEYTDISGHWCEETVNILKGNGYYLDGTSFSPSKKITQENFLRYLYTPNQRGYSSEEFYKMVEQNGIIKENEKSPTTELMRKDAAKFVIRYLGQDKAASFSDIYKNTFSDNVEKSYMGYAALSNALKIIKGDKYGRFLGNNTLSNSEAALVIYRTLEVK